MIVSLYDIFSNGNITVEKKDEKYIMKIEATGFGKKTKYEIELEKNDPVIDDNTKILNKIKEIDENYQKIKEEINHIKSQNNQMTYNEEERNKIIKEIKNELNIKEILKDLLINDKDINNIFESKLNNQKNEENNKIEESVNKIIKEKYSNKVDIETYNEDINKIKNDINNQINEINNIKNNIKENIKNELNNKDNVIIKKLNEQMNIINNKIKDNYATLKMQIKKDDIGNDITILRQCWIYKLFKENLIMVK
jgi:DNA repair exonuclease SbcCD ATPase subunit